MSSSTSSMLYVDSITDNVISDAAFVPDCVHTGPRHVRCSLSLRGCCEGARGCNRSPPHRRSPHG